MSRASTSLRRCLSPWPLAGYHWYRPVKRQRPGFVACCCHHLPYSTGTISPTARRCSRGLLQYSLLAIILMLLVVWLGSEYEQWRMRDAPDTLYLYQLDEICGIVHATPTGSSTRSNTENRPLQHNDDNIVTIETYGSIAEFETVVANNSDATSAVDGGVVAHCGSCGSCSNPHDVQIYDNTRGSLFQDTTHCAKVALVWGRKTASKCMRDAVGFTSDCNSCWVENIMCDLRKCIFTCIWYGLFSQVDGVDSGRNSTALNPCTQCDELRCGRQFIECAGANRRRTGILSDIDRDTENEVCSAVTEKWWNDPDLQEQWRMQQQQQQPQKQVSAAAAEAAENNEDGPRRRWLRD